MSPVRTKAAKRMAELMVQNRDNIHAVQDPAQIISTFPYMVWNNASNTPDACIKQCQAFGYNAAGLEYGSQCCKQLFGYKHTWC